MANRANKIRRHIKLFHKQKGLSAVDCPRCTKNMGTKKALQEHLAVSRDEVCTVQPRSIQNPEDGISTQIEDILNGRRSNYKVDTWETLWQTLFPNDPREGIPDPVFVPPVELDEVYDFHAQQCREDLRRRISDEEQRAAGSDQDIDDHVDRMVEICEKYVQDVFRGYRERKIGNLPGPTRRKQVQNPKAVREQKHPPGLDIPPSMAGQQSFASANDDPGSASSMDSALSTQSPPWEPLFPYMSPAFGNRPLDAFLGAIEANDTPSSRHMR